MTADPDIPPSANDHGGNDVPPLLPSTSDRKPGSAQRFLTGLLSLCLGLFLVDAFISLADDMLILLLDVHGLTVVRGLVAFPALLVAIAIYLLMGLTPMIPKFFLSPSHFST